MPQPNQLDTNLHLITAGKINGEGALLRSPRSTVMDFEIVGEVSDIETIATGTGVRDRTRVRKRYGRGRWCKL